MEKGHIPDNTKRGIGEGLYYCARCKKWKPRFAATTSEWQKLSIEYQDSTICRECFLELTNSKFLKSELLAGKRTTIDFKEKLRRFL